MSVQSPTPSPSAWPPASSAAFPRIGSLPAYVFAQINAEKAERIAAGEDVIDLGMGNPDLGTPRHIVDELVAHAAHPKHHRYSVSRGIYGLREGMADHYRDRYGVRLDPESEVVVTIGAKEGIAHLMLAILGDGDGVLVPAPAYPIHSYSVGFAGGRVIPLPLAGTEDGFVDADALLGAVEEACRAADAPPRALLLSFPNNPTTLQAPPGFFERAVEVCRANRLLLIHDFAYADFGFDGDPPSVLSVPGAKEIAVEFFSMSKSYCMAGWRVGFCLGNPAMVGALTKIKSYLDYGIFQPIQIAAAHALRAGQECVGETREVYRRRAAALVSGLRAAGWNVPSPRATMFVWAQIPEPFRGMGSIGFARFLLRESGVVVSPGVGFGPQGEGHVRFALIEPESRLAQASERIARALAAGPPTP
jgi:alanine-synthesizing transaminase